MKQITLSLQITEFDSSEALEATERDLVNMAREMTTHAYAPYSEFFVGAALLLENGEIVKGSNQENAAYPSGLCAERVAVFAASSAFPNVKIKTIAISAKSAHRTMDYPVSPCGGCRQVLLEYEFKQNSPVKVLLSGESGKIVVLEKVKDLLPLSFTSSDLKKL
jgi:cytidine deaminase